MNEDTVTITLTRSNAEKLLASAPPEEFRANFQPEHVELFDELTKATA